MACCLLIQYRDSGADTGPVPAEYLRTINIHGRDFQKYSVDHSVHLVPVDEVEAGNT